MRVMIHVGPEAEIVAQRPGMPCLQSAVAGAMQETSSRMSQNQEPHDKLRLHDLGDRYS